MYNVKKAYPYAVAARDELAYMNSQLAGIEDKEQQEEYVKNYEKLMFKRYEKELRALTISQGRILIKLVDRECNSTAYEAMKAFIGPVRSGMWQAFAWMFGASLKKGYQPEGVDRLTERVVLMVEAGQL